MPIDIRCDLVVSATPGKQWRYERKIRHELRRAAASEAFALLPLRAAEREAFPRLPNLTSVWSHRTG